jgi:hypothetical protein
MFYFNPPHPEPSPQRGEGRGNSVVKISIEEFPNRLNRLTDRSTDETDGDLGIYDASANSFHLASIPLTLSLLRISLRSISPKGRGIETEMKTW